MSDTAETDANCWREGTSEWVAANFARKLERERDEAQALAEERKTYWDSEYRDNENLRKLLQVLTAERNEAREIAQDLLEKNAKQAVEIVRLKEASK